MNNVLTQKNAIVFAANSRLLRFLNKDLTKSSDTVRNNHLYTLNGFIEHSWSELQDMSYPKSASKLLTPTAESHIWRHLIDAHANLPLLSTYSLEKDLRNARIIIENWNISNDELTEGQSEESLFFNNLYQHFTTLLAENALTTYETAGKIITAAYSDKVLSGYDATSLFGFTELPPSINNLFDSLSSNTATELRFEHYNDKNKTVVLETYGSPEDEIAKAAHWARTLSEAEPDAEIGIIVPALVGNLSAVKNAFLREFHPSSITHHHTVDFGLKFDISTGEPLLTQPIIADIFTTLMLRESDIARDDLLQILQSPFNGFATDFLTSDSWINNEEKNGSKNFTHIEQIQNNNTVYKLIDWVNSRSSYRLATNQLLNQFKKEMDAQPVPVKHCEDYLSQILCFRENHRQTKQKQSISKWNTWLLDQLKILGWPGTRVSDSTEYQALKTFFTTLDEMTKLDQVSIFSKGTSFNEYLNELKNHLSNTVFHKQTQQTKISVMGIMEGAGLKFDYCRIIGLTDKQLPTQPELNPFLPIALQKKHNTPKSSYNKEYEYSQALMSLYIDNSRSVILSYPLMIEGADTRPSPLIHHYLTATSKSTGSPLCDKPVACTDIDKLYHDGLDFDQLETVEDYYAPAITQPTRLRGGTQYFKLDAINPMFAYLVYQLGAKPIEPANIGFNALDRGNIIHTVMQNIWNDLNNKNNLLEVITQEKLNKLIESCTADAIAHIKHTKDSRIEESLVSFESARINQMLINLLNMESHRQDFTIDNTEFMVEVNIDLLTIHLRIDRADLDESGRLIIFDYKTGKTNLNGLQKQPLQDVQLPIYAIAQQNKQAKEKLAGVGYINVSSKELGYKGIGDNINIGGFQAPENLNKEQLPNTWQETLAWWQDQLNQQAKAIIQGQCTYEIRDKSQAPFYEYLRPITRAYLN